CPSGQHPKTIFPKLVSFSFNVLRLTLGILGENWLKRLCQNYDFKVIFVMGMKEYSCQSNQSSENHGSDKIAF
ncbi:MAG: hypothetical protein MUD08_15285, partial [Cytophagales bacterium]|nr:hypothetical protein [Cytophagales bacterium]